MKYTSNEKLDLDEINKKAKSTGFSDRARRYLASALLGINIMGAVPAFGNDVKVTDYDLNSSNGSQFEEVVNVNDINSTVVEEFANREKLDIKNIEEFEARSSWVMENIMYGKEIIYINTVNDITNEIINKAKTSDTVIKIDNDYDYSYIKEVNENSYYTPEDATMIKEHFEKYYFPIRDNPNLSQKEKFIAAMSVLGSLTTYDYEATKRETAYANAAVHTARNQYSVIKYGKTVCTGYADSVDKICDMLGIDCEKVYGFAVLEKAGKELQEIVLSSLEGGQSIENAANHVVNMISFEDGTSYMLDMTATDISGTMDENFFMTDSEHFKGLDSFYFKAGKKDFATCDVKMREAVLGTQMMPREEITVALDKAKKELPYIAKLESLDEIQKKFELDNKSTAKLFNIYEAGKKLLGKFAGVGTKQQALPSGMGTMIADNQVEQSVQGDNGRVDETREQGHQNSFRDMVAGNGEYARNADAYLTDYHNRQQEAPQQQTQQPQVLENDVQER